MVLPLAISLVLASGCGARSRTFADPEDDGNTDGGPSDDDGSSVPVEADGCPPYPSGPYGWAVGDVVEDFSLPGNDAADGIWSMGDFCDATVGPDRSTVLVLLLVALDSSVMGAPSYALAVDNLQKWQKEYASRGLVVLLVALMETMDVAAWVDGIGYTDRWAADQIFMTGRFFSGPTVGVPAAVVIDLETMRIAEVQEGWEDDEGIFGRFLR